MYYDLEGHVSRKTISCQSTPIKVTMLLGGGVVGMGELPPCTMGMRDLLSSATGMGGFPPCAIGMGGLSRSSLES